MNVLRFMQDKSKISLHILKNYVLLPLERMFNQFFSVQTMKKVFMSFAVVAVMVAAASCGNCCKKSSEAAAAEEAAVETKARTDSCAACCDSCAACTDSCAVCADSCAACAE